MELYVVRPDETLGHPSWGQEWINFLLCYAGFWEPGALKFAFGNIDMGRRIYVCDVGLWWTFICLFSHIASELLTFIANVYCVLIMCQILFQMLYLY